MIINLWITKECNLRCTYCYEKDRFERIDKADNIEKILDWLCKNIKNISKIIFHGGEPLLKFKYIKKIVSKVVFIKPDIRFGITTNGTLWNEEISDFFIKYKENFDSDITISIDGDRFTHDQNRISISGETFDKVLDTSQKLLDIDVNVRARMTFTPSTLKLLNENIIFLFNIGFRTISSSFDFTDKQWFNIDKETVLDEYVKIYKYWNKIDDVNIGIIDELRVVKKLDKCKCEVNLCLDGSIYPCTFVVGNNSQKIGDIYSGFNYDKIKEIVKFSLKNNSKCNRCSNKDYCESNRCKLMNLSINDSYFEPNKIICAFENIKNLVKERIILID